MYETFPDELKKEIAWVNVRNDSKVPMRSTENKAASSSLPSSWSSFDDAVKAVENGIYNGIGYVFHDTDLVGIDIDAGFDDCFLSQLSIDVMEHCKSYTEKSRSGRGIHILVKGHLPFKGRNNRAGVEIYRTGRYFICTGNTLVYPEIIENQSAIDYIVETYFPDAPREESQRSSSNRIYSPVYPKPEHGKIALAPKYPPITSGSRNLSLTSLAGQMHTQGYSKGEIFKELLRANSMACEPPLDRSEVEMIVNSVSRYQR